MAKLRGIPLDATVPTDGQLLRYDGPTNKWTPATISGDGSSPANYVFAYATGDQSGTVSFDTVPLINGWTHTINTYTCPQTGLYLIQYEGQGYTGGTAAQPVISVYVNSVVVQGSLAGSFVALTAGQFGSIPISKSIIANLNVGDTLFIGVGGGTLRALSYGNNIPTAAARAATKGAVQSTRKCPKGAGQCTEVTVSLVE